MNRPSPSPGADDGFPGDPPLPRGGDELLRSFEEISRLSPDRPGGNDPDMLAPAGEQPGWRDAAEPAETAGETYWTLSRTPLTSLVFTLPLVLAYEGGVLLLGRGTPRNGADVWLRQLLDALGFGAYFLLPTLTVLGLLAWHHLEHERWRYSTAVLAGMAGECLLWALALVGLARLQESFWPLQVGHGWGGVLAGLISFCGAGLYEEVLFRLLLLPAVVWVLERSGFSTIAACCWSLALTSLLFSAAHYVGPLGDTFDLYSFTFRSMAGAFFGGLFLLRGFGIAVGTHAVYDLMIGLL